MPAVLVGLLFWSACAGPGTTQREAPDAPRRPVTRTVAGYRIQILTTPEKVAADRSAEQARQWWQDVPAAERPAYLGEAELTVDVDWRQPYYRVRLGAFASRAEAERALRAVASAFPEAFIVPDTVVVTR